MKHVPAWLWLMAVGIVITLGGAAILSFLDKDTYYLRPVGWAVLAIGILTLLVGAILGLGRIKRAPDKTKTDDAGAKLIFIGLGADVLGAALLSILDKDTRDLLPLGWALLVIGMAAMVAGIALCSGGGKRIRENQSPLPRRENRQQKRYR